MALPDRSYPLGTHVYGLYTNKGGVGKTTLTFHLSTTYATLFPDKVVVAIDMCPQSNLSATILTKTTANTRDPGDVVVQSMQNDLKSVPFHLTRTICGVLRSRLQSYHIEPQKFLTSVKSENKNLQIPKNLMLLCGDNHLDMMVPTLYIRAQTPGEPGHNPFIETHCYLRDYIRSLADYFKEKEDKDLVVFIDTNPAMTIYTQIALCAMTELIVPLNADDYSLQAVQGMFRQIYALYPSSNPMLRDYEKKTFAWIMKECGMELPRIAAIVHNRNPVVKENDAAPATIARNYLAMSAEQCKLVLDGYFKAEASGRDMLRRIFKLRTDDNGSEIIYTTETQNDFRSDFTTQFRDMRSCGVAAAHCGFPLWQLINKYKCVDKKFKSDKKEFEERVKVLTKDLLYAMKTIFGEAVMNTADPAARERLEQIAGRLVPTRGNNGGKDDNEAPTKGRKRSNKGNKRMPPDLEVQREEQPAKKGKQ